MADIDGKDLTLDDAFATTDGFIYFKDSDGEFTRASNIAAFFNRLGITVTVSGTTTSFAGDVTVTGDVTITGDSDNLVNNDGNTGSETQLKVKAFEIGTWDMDTDGFQDVVITGLSDTDYDNIISVSALIFNDTGTSSLDIVSGAVNTANTNVHGGCGVDRSGTHQINLFRVASGDFDSANYSAVGNRGKISIIYEA